jgi:hypothetical protein
MRKMINQFAMWLKYRGARPIRLKIGRLVLSGQVRIIPLFLWRWAVDRIDREYARRKALKQPIEPWMRR